MTVDFLRALRDPRDSSALLAEMLLDISFVLHELHDLEGVDRVAVRELVAGLSAGLLQVEHMPGRRRVNFCDAAVVLEVTTAEVGRPSPWQASGLFAGETAVRIWKVDNPGFRGRHPWQLFSDSAFHIMVLEWLVQRLDIWCGQYYPVAGAARSMRVLAQRAVQSIPSQANLLRLALLDALGTPRDLATFLLRAELQRCPPLPARLQAAVTENWSGRAAWCRRSCKLFPLAAVAADLAGAPCTDARAVRDSFLAMGLARNAWAHLMRLPAPVITFLAAILVVTPDDDGRAVFLREFSFWLSRLGKRFRYYRIPQERLLTALVWACYESARLGGGSSLLSPDGLSELLPESLFRYGMLISRMNLDAEHHLRMRALLLAFSFDVLESETPLDVLMNNLLFVLDWYVMEGSSFPVSWFKRDFWKISARSQRWHELLLRQLEAERQQRLEQEFSAENTVSWAAPLSSFECDDVVFRALLSKAELELEGALMRHCVGTYASRCARGDTLIYAVSEQGQRLGTLEMYRQSSPRGWRTMQFKGEKNRELMTLIRRGGRLEEIYTRFKHDLAAASVSPAASTQFCTANSSATP